MFLMEYIDDNDSVHTTTFFSVLFGEKLFSTCRIANSSPVCMLEFVESMSVLIVLSEGITEQPTLELFFQIFR